MSLLHSSSVICTGRAYVIFWSVRYAHVILPYVKRRTLYKIISTALSYSNFTLVALTDERLLRYQCMVFLALGFRVGVYDAQSGIAHGPASPFHSYSGFRAFEICLSWSLCQQRQLLTWYGVLPASTTVWDSSLFLRVGVARAPILRGE